MSQLCAIRGEPLPVRPSAAPAASSEENVLGSLPELCKSTSFLSAHDEEHVELGSLPELCTRTSLLSEAWKQHCTGMDEMDSIEEEQEATNRVLTNGMLLDMYQVLLNDTEYCSSAEKRAAALEKVLNAGGFGGYIVDHGVLRELLARDMHQHMIVQGEQSYRGAPSNLFLQREVV